MKKIIYICDINEDIDDMIAVEYLHLQNRLDYVVLDRKSSSPRINELKQLGITFKDNIDAKATIVFVGGSLTKVADYLNDGNELIYLIIQGGFAGSNLVQNPLKKFKDKTEVRTFNLNLDVAATLKVFELKKQVQMPIILISKNVCHSEYNSFGNIHKDNFLIKYDLNKGKRLHDLLAVKDGLNWIDESKTLLEYEWVTPHCNGTDKFAKWSSIKKGDLLISVGFNKEILNERKQKTIA